MLSESDLTVEFNNMIEVQSKPNWKDGFRVAVNQNAFLIPGIIKWQLDRETSKQDQNPMAPDRHLRFLDGLMRGIMAETLSKSLPIGDCRKVFGSNDEDHWKGISIKTTEEVAGDPKVSNKAKLLRWAVQKSFIDAPLSKSIEDAMYGSHEFVTNIPGALNDQSLTDELTRQVVEPVTDEILDGYGSAGDGENSGVLYGDSSMPDSFLVNKDGDIVGFVEVKAYTPFEFETLVNELEELEKHGGLHGFATEIKNEFGDLLPKVGVSVATEVQFIDHLRTVAFGQKSLDGDTYILLRFANNISDNLINRYGSLIEKWGYKNLQIQRLPMGTRDLSQEGKKFVQNNLKNISRRVGEGRYSPEQMELLRRYISSSTR